MKKPVILSLHLLYWGPKFIIWILSLLTFHEINSSPIYYLWSGLNMVLPLISFYVFYLYLFPVFLARKKILLFIISAFVVWTILIIISASLVPGEFRSSPPMIYGVMSFTSAILLQGLIGSFFKGFITWYSEIRLKEQLVQKNLQSELALLKAQINPHFLFNTINNIDVLIEKEPKTASKYLKQLSEIMRFMLHETSSDLIPLSTELEYISKYIELQKIRTFNERFVNLTISGENHNLTIAPAIFIPFIENAFKHSTNKKIEDAINIIIEIAGNDISFNCRNYFDNSRSFAQEKSGLGIDLIKQRLKLLYNEKHQLDIIKTENHFEVKLKIITK